MRKQQGSKLNTTNSLYKTLTHLHYSLIGKAGCDNVMSKTLAIHIIMRATEDMSTGEINMTASSRSARLNGVGVWGGVVRRQLLERATNVAIRRGSKLVALHS
jgi:hypothetical protein